MDKRKHFMIIWSFYLHISVFRTLETSMKSFKNVLADAKYVMVLTGAGISAECGIPTYRGKDRKWRNMEPSMLDSIEAFKENPSLVWEFYSYRRGLILRCKPNKAHLALAECQRKFAAQGRNLTIITQNFDGLHTLAGTKNVIEMHGSVFRTKCTTCNRVEENRRHPIVEALRFPRGDPNAKDLPPIDDDLLPHCKHQDDCDQGLLRPDVVWFGESLDPKVLTQIREVMENVELCIVVGSTLEVSPADMYVQRLQYRGVPVAEFNIEETRLTNTFSFFIQGPCTKTLPEALSVHTT